MAQAARQRSSSYRSYADFDTYVYGNTVRTARYEAPQRETRKPRADVHVIDGHRSENPLFQAIPVEYARAFKLALVVVVVLAAICSVRVFLSSSTVPVLESVNALESSLETAKASTNVLEIQHSILASSTRIEAEAANLGMVAPENVTYLKVAIPSKVGTNADGSISLSGTIDNLEDYAAIMAR